MGISVKANDGSRLFLLLKDHPHVDEVVHSECDGVEFANGGAWRSVQSGWKAGNLYGLVESVDNNPLVCASTFRVPSPLATLAHIALDPLIETGLLAEPPVILAPDGCQAQLPDVWPFSKATCDTVTLSEPWLFAVTVIAKIQSPADLGDLTGFYLDRYQRCPLVQPGSGDTITPDAIREGPTAQFWLTTMPDEEQWLVKIQVLSHRDGKAGACQIIQAMNVMCGLPDLAGIRPRI